MMVPRLERRLSFSLSLFRSLSLSLSFSFKEIAGWGLFEEKEGKRNERRREGKHAAFTIFHSQQQTALWTTIQQGEEADRCLLACISLSRIGVRKLKKNNSNLTIFFFLFVVADQVNVRRRGSLRIGDLLRKYRFFFARIRFTHAHLWISCVKWTELLVCLDLFPLVEREFKIWKLSPFFLRECQSHIWNRSEHRSGSVNGRARNCKFFDHCND